MDLIHIVVLAVVQGLTEFLPISSSAHLVLAPRVLGFADQGLAFDVAVHLGSLLAVIGYFRSDIVEMTRDFLRSFTGPEEWTENSRLAWCILLATLPVAVFGLLFKDIVASELRSPQVIAASTIGFGLLLWLFDVTGRRNRDEHSLTWKHALVIGLFQALALIPGTSRSGVTITAGLMLGLSRKAASRFSFLLAIPTILMAGGLAMLELIQSTASVDWLALMLGVLLSFVTAYLCIHYFLRFIERISMLPFVLYRLLLGIAILVLVTS